MSSYEQLGVVASRSGILVFIDTGCLNIWSHDRPPLMPYGVLSDELTAKANSSVDLRIIGVDAERAGRMLDMSWHPVYVYDQPREHSELESKIEKLVREHKLDARFEVTDPRITHRQRVELAIEFGKGAGEFQFHGMRAVAVSGVPTLRPLRILGTRSSEPHADRWRQVSVECRPDVGIAHSEKAGDVAVDYARILVADIDALGLWKHEEALDGLADYVFWGRDAAQVARAFNAPRLSDNEFGWLNVPVAQAAEWGTAVENYRDEGSLKMAADFRPHSHHWQVMKPTRETGTESGTTEIHGMKVCNFMTTWGDGCFEVYRDLDDSGQLVQIRVRLEPEG